MRDKAGATSFDKECRRRAGTSSGPDAFRGFRLCRSFATPLTSMVRGEMVGYPEPESFLSADWGSSLVKTDLNCSLRMHALERASE